MEVVVLVRLLAGALLLAALIVAPIARPRAQTADDLASLNSQVEALLKAGKYAEALPLAEKAVKSAEEKRGPNDAAIAGPLLKLGALLGRLGRIPEMEAHERRALAIREATLGPDHPETAEALEALAGTLKETGRPPEAERLYQRSLAIREKAQGPDHTDVGRVLNSLG